MSKRALSIYSVFYAVYGYVSINMGLPAYPILQKIFNAPNSHVKLAMTGFLFAFAFAQLVWGPLSDRFGRRPISLLALFLALIGSLITAFSHALSIFILGRFIEGLGTGFTTLVAKALLLDKLTKKEMHLTMTYVVSSVAFMPAIAPVIGGEILQTFGWRAIYITLAAIGLLLWIATFLYLSETVTKKIATLSVFSVIKTYLHLLKNLRFMGYFIPFSLTLSGLIVFYAVAPYIYINQLHIAPNHYGYILLFVGLSYMLGASLARILSNKFSGTYIVMTGFVLTFSTGLTMALFNTFLPLNLFIVTIPMGVYAIGCGFVSPISNTLALGAVASHEGGSASAVVNCMSMACSSLLTAILANFSITTLYPLAIPFMIMAISCLVIGFIHRG